jgi:hypothetical protein
VRGHSQAWSPSPQSSPIKGEDVGSRLKAVWFAALFLVFALEATSSSLSAAEPAEQLIAAAKKEGDEIVFVAGAQTFGGKKGLTELEAAFNKKFGLTARVHFAAGPQMSSMAARLITEAKAGRKSSTDFFLGSQSHFALHHQEKTLETVNWSGIFPWLTKEMEISPGEGLPNTCRKIGSRFLMPSNKMTFISMVKPLD